MEEHEQCKKQNENNGGCAFPVPGMQLPNDQIVWPEYGMTMLDYFAAKALQGILASGNVNVNDKLENVELAYSYARMMLYERTL